MSGTYEMFRFMFWFFFIWVASLVVAEIVAVRLIKCYEIGINLWLAGGIVVVIWVFVAGLIIYVGGR